MRGDQHVVGSDRAARFFECRPNAAVGARRVEVEIDRGQPGEETVERRVIVGPPPTAIGAVA